MRSTAVGRQQRNRNRIADHLDICLRGKVLPRRLLSEVFCAEHQTKNPLMSDRRGIAETATLLMRMEHVVVVCGSMAGLLCARVLSDYCNRVTIIERDWFPNTVENPR